METKKKATPEGYNTLTPYLNIKGAAKAIEFYEKAFDAKEIMRLSAPDGTVAHAEIEIGDSIFMLAEENPQWGNLSPLSLGGSPVTLCLYVEDVDAVFAKALKEGATITDGMEVKDQFYGERAGSITDPFGHKWSIMTHIEDVSTEEMQRRMDTMF